MASDRSPLSKRLKSLAHRAGLPVDDAVPAEGEPAVAVPASAPAAEQLDADEQPTGDIPAVAEQPTDEQPALHIPEPEQPTTTFEPLSHAPTSDAPTTDPFAHGEAPAPDPFALPDAPSVDPFAHDAGPSLTPPIVPARAIEPTPEPAAEAEPQQASADDDDEPFSPRSTIWPQTTPTPRFEPQAEPQPPAQPSPPATWATSDTTFPEPSPTPVEGDVAAPTDAAAAAAAIPAAAPAPVSAEIEVSDATIEQAALEGEPGVANVPAPAPAPAKARVLGGLRRLRGGRDESADTPAAAVAVPTAAVATDAPPTVIPVPAAPEQAEPQPDPVPAPVPAAPAHTPIEPPAKPSFTERAALRRRAKSLRARRDTGLLELGAIVLDQRRFGDPTGGSLMRRRTDELADLDSELASIEQVLDDDGPAETVAQLGVVRCLTCTALVGPRDRFCVQCGAPRPEDGGSPSSS